MPIIMLECKECHAVTMDQVVTAEEHETLLKGGVIKKECLSNQCKGKITDHVYVQSKTEEETCP